MPLFIFKRILMMIPVLLGVTFIIFFILNLAPGDPAAIMLGDGASIEAIEQLREELGLNDPLMLRYVNYIRGLLRGDMGISWRNRISVWEQVMDRLPNTMILASAAIIVALAMGIPLGIISAKKQYSIMDNTAVVLSLVAVSMPNFWLGLLLSLFFALHLGWLPSQGMGVGLIPLLRSLILPAITLGTDSAAMIARMTRSSMLEVIRQDYITTARSKGITEAEVTRRHMFKNALIPIITAIGLRFGFLLGGSMITETVFSWPGLGRLMVTAIVERDIPVVLGTVTFIAIIFSFVNLIVDIIYAFVDPRIKSQYKSAVLFKFGRTK